MTSNRTNRQTAENKPKAHPETSARRKPAASADAQRIRYLEERGVNFNDTTKWRRQRERKQAAEQASIPEDGQRYLLSYGRVSSSRLGSSDRRQGSNWVNICLKNNLGDPASIKSFFDYGVSGTKLNRPELDGLIEFVLAHWGCDLMVEDIDRLARNAKVLLIIGGQLMKGGVRIWDLNGEVTAEEFMERGLRAAADWRKITGRGNVDRRENIREGALYSTPTLGFRKPAKGMLVVDRKEAELLKSIYELFLKDRSYASIARWLQKRGVINQNGEIWSGNRVKDTLSNKINIGYVETQFEDGEIVRHYRPELQIIDDDTFAAVQEKMKRAPMPPRKKAGLGISKSNPYLLGGKVSCSACGKPLTILKSRKEGVRAYLVCSRYMQHECMEGDRFPYEAIERTVLHSLGEVLTPDFDDHFLAKAKEEHEVEHRKIEARREVLDTEISRLTTNIEEAFVDKEGEEFRTILAGLKRRLAKAVANKAKLKSAHFFGFAASILSTLPEELERMVTRSPFLAKNEDERELAKALFKIIKNIVPKRQNDESVALEFDLDFSSHLGEDAGKLVVHRVSAFDAPKVRLWRPTDVREAIEREGTLLRDEEFSRLMTIQALATHLSAFDRDVVRTAMNAIVVAMEVDCGVPQATFALGYDRVSRVRQATSKIREIPLAFQVMDAIIDLRGALPGERRIAKRPRPRRRLREKYLSSGHAIMTLKHTQLGSPDEPLSDAEWELVRSAIIAAKGAHMNGGYIRQLRGYLRRHLDALLKILREDASVSRVTGPDHVSTFHHALRGIEKNGYLDLLVEVLATHSSKS